MNSNPSETTTIVLSQQPRNGERIERWVHGNDGQGDRLIETTERTETIIGITVMSRADLSPNSIYYSYPEHPPVESS